MSWMDSWSRPGKHAAVPPPFYLTQGDDVPYCRTCGRVISARKQHHQKTTNTIKYCSDRCRNRKPGPLDKRIERTIVALLNAEPAQQTTGAAKPKATKGDRRIIVTCEEIEEAVFGSRHDPTKTFGRKKNRASRALGDDQDGEWKSVDMEDDQDHDTSSDQDLSGAKDTHHRGVRPLVRPSQWASDVNGSVGGEKGWAERQSETAEELEKRMEGQQRAEQREMVRRAARRGVVFGFAVDSSEQDRQGQHATAATTVEGRNDGSESETRRKCEALMNGSVVEPSFAKGNWAIRWRE
ncbi:hypothetical protein A1O7_06232 [Cladophialophora yegresii CBS 114405]|uniref:Uncharacterized protein n=1 Tax=Cladophialophora yegresii CBS 114405 TaxID=1182544 RepID=W9VST3_9EURO|nr:uncharacterized protein A1O7_06232 [Cladophialophora yegresii CBS 114405]EXJ58802.1 hypothetical protein A1O7_06232 [Cladophialophora yegresii CBS 114405]